MTLARFSPGHVSGTTVHGIDRQRNVGRKQPCANNATRRLGKTRSGLPGRSARRGRNRSPIAWVALRMRISGPVFFPLIRAIVRERRSANV